MPEARGKLKQQAAQFVRFGERQDTGFEFLGLAGGPLIFVVRELPPDFDGKLKIIRCTPGPAFCCFGTTWPVKRGVDLDDVEVP